MSAHFAIRLVPLVLALAGLAGCSGGANQPKPAELKPFVTIVAVKQAWTAQLGEPDFPLTPAPVATPFFCMAAMALSRRWTPAPAETAGA